MTIEQRLVNTLRFITVCEQAYGSQGPTMVLCAMRDAARMTLDDYSRRKRGRRVRCTRCRELHLVDQACTFDFDNHGQ